ncbi:hypothetical protein ACJX0J_011901, partial [Zea mays]
LGIGDVIKPTCIQIFYPLLFMLIFDAVHIGNPPRVIGKLITRDRIKMLGHAEAQTEFSLFGNTHCMSIFFRHVGTFTFFFCGAFNRRNLNNAGVRGTKGLSVGQGAAVVQKSHEAMGRRCATPEERHNSGDNQSVMHLMELQRDQVEQRIDGIEETLKK